jgi:hypothetical protein
MFARKVFVLLLNWRKYCAVAGVGLLVLIQYRPKKSLPKAEMSQVAIVLFPRSSYLHQSIFLTFILLSFAFNLIKTNLQNANSQPD